MNIRKALVVCTGVLYATVWVLSLLPCHSYGQEAEKLKKIQKEIRTKESAIRRIKIQKRSVLDELDKLDKGISSQNQRLNEAQQQMRTIQEDQKKLLEEIKTTETWIEEKRQFFNKLMVSFYKMGRFGLLPVLFSTDPFPIRLRNMNFIRILMQKDIEKIQAFGRRLEEKVKKEEALAANMAKEKNWEQRLQKRLETLSVERQKKAQWLFQIENERALYERLLSELQVSSKQLEKLIMDKERERKRSRNLQVSLIPGASFKKQKGLLPWPVEGKVVREFGKQQDPRYNTTIVNDGIDIKVVQDQEIRAIYGGSVVYAGWFRGYGQLVIIDHGDNYYSIVAHADRLTKDDGDKVEVGEILGYAGETGSLIGPAIHFEIRHNGEPLDPLAWVKNR